MILQLYVILQHANTYTNFYVHLQKLIKIYILQHIMTQYLIKGGFIILTYVHCISSRIGGLISTDNKTYNAYLNGISIQ